MTHHEAPAQEIPSEAMFSIPPMRFPRRRWEFTSISTYDPFGNQKAIIDAKLSEGWEPFAAKDRNLFLRRRRWRL